MYNNTNVYIFIFTLVLISIYFFYFNEPDQKPGSSSTDSSSQSTPIKSNIDKSIDQLIGERLNVDDVDFSSLDLEEVSMADLQKRIDELQTQLDQLEPPDTNGIEYFEAKQRPNTDVKEFVKDKIKTRIAKLNELKSTAPDVHATWATFTNEFDDYVRNIETTSMYEPPVLTQDRKQQLDVFDHIANSNIFFTFTNYDGGEDIRIIVQYLDVFLSSNIHLLKYIIDITTENEIQPFINELETLGSYASTEFSQKQIINIVLYLSALVEQCIFDLDNCKNEIMTTIDPKELSRSIFENMIFALMSFYHMNMDNLNEFLKTMNPNISTNRLLSESDLSNMRHDFLKSKMSPINYDVDDEHKISSHIQNAPINIVFFRFFHYVLGFSDNSGMFIRLAALFDGLLEAILEIMLSMNEQDCYTWFESRMCEAVSSQMFDLMMEIVCMLFKDTSLYITQTISFLTDTIDDCIRSKFSRNQSINDMNSEMTQCIVNAIFSKYIEININGETVTFTLPQLITYIILLMYKNIEDFVKEANMLFEKPPVLFDEDFVPSTDIKVYKYIMNTYLNQTKQYLNIQDSAYYLNGNIDAFTSVILQFVNSNELS